MSASGGTTPATVMIIRHGEKPGDPSDDSDGGPDLSVQGGARAAALPGLFLSATPNLGCALDLAQSDATFTGQYAKTAVPGTSPRFSTPDYLFATADSSQSSRPRQTITPTAAALGLSINNEYNNKQKHIDDLAALLWTAPYAGKIVLICWHHGTIQELAGALNGTGATKWVGTVFDRLWVITYSQGLAIQQFGQQLLFGDEVTVPTNPW